MSTIGTGIKIQAPLTREEALAFIWNNAPESERKIENGHRHIRMAWDVDTKKEYFQDMENAPHRWIELMLDIVANKLTGFHQGKLH